MFYLFGNENGYLRYFEMKLDNVCRGKINAFLCNNNYNGYQFIFNGKSPKRVDVQKNQ